MDSFENLDSSAHMLQWLSDEPYETIRWQVENILREQVPDSVLRSFRVTSKPEWLTGARQADEDDGKAILVKTAVAFEFELSVEGGGRSFDLAGVYTWAGFQLDDPENRHQRVWFDVDGTLATFGANGELRARVTQA